MGPLFLRYFVVVVVFNKPYETRTVKRKLKMSCYAEPTKGLLPKNLKQTFGPDFLAQRKQTNTNTHTR